MANIYGSLASEHHLVRRIEMVKPQIIKPLVLTLIAAAEILYCRVHPSPKSTTVETVLLVQIWLICVLVLWLNAIWRSGSIISFVMMDFLVIAAVTSLCENSGIRQWILTTLFVVGAVHFLNRLFRRIAKMNIPGVAHPG
jgi:hypothetical protein